MNKTKHNPEWKDAAVALHLYTGYSWRRIAKALHVPKSTVSDYLRLKFK